MKEKKMQPQSTQLECLIGQNMWRATSKNGIKKRVDLKKLSKKYRVY